MDPLEVVGQYDAVGALLASMNDEELFAKGQAAAAAGDQALAARAYDRLCTAFPKSKHFATGSYNGALAHQQLSEWQPALDRLQPLLDLEHGTQDQVDAGFRAAECLYHMGRFGEAIALLRVIQGRNDLSLNVRIEAETQVGICQIEDSQLTEAEATLRHVAANFENADTRERLDLYYPAQAQFFLGEIYRIYFEQVALDPNQAGGTTKLAADLEYKAEMLLSAQGHYLRAMRIGHAVWATAAGTRVGALYESLYDAMMQSPAPVELDEDQKQLYFEELHKKIKVLAGKSIGLYERTLEAAERTGVSGPFIDQARERLERMKQVLLAAAGHDEEPTPAPEPEPAPEPAPKPSSSAHPKASKGAVAQQKPAS
jgi:tetratricopeptide (TPR) repeat protein